LQRSTHKAQSANKGKKTHPFYSFIFFPNQTLVQVPTFFIPINQIPISPERTKAKPISSSSSS